MAPRLTFRTIAHFIGLLYRAIRIEAPDVIVSHLLPMNLLVLALKRIGLVRVPVVVVEHSNRSAVERATGDKVPTHYLSSVLTRLLFPGASAVIGVSRGVAADFASRLPASAVTRTIENGIDVDRVRAAASQGTAESEFTKRLGSPVVVAAGRLVPEKAFNIVIEAFALLKARDVLAASKLVILGEGPELDALRNQALRLGVAGDVHFLGFIDNPWAVFAESDVFVLGSRYEGFGLVVAEAVACGLPVVSTDCPSGPADVLRENPLSRLVPVDDAAAMAKAIGELLAKSVDYVPELAPNFTLNQMTEEYEKLLHEIVAANARNKN